MSVLEVTTIRRGYEIIGEMVNIDRVDAGGMLKIIGAQLLITVSIPGKATQLLLWPEIR